MKFDNFFSTQNPEMIEKNKSKNFFYHVGFWVRCTYQKLQYYQELILNAFYNGILLLANFCFKTENGREKKKEALFLLNLGFGLDAPY